MLGNRLDRLVVQRRSLASHRCRPYYLFCALLVATFIVTGCGRGAAPTRTPFPTWTPTPLGGVPVAPAVGDQPAEAVVAATDTPVSAPPAEAPTATPALPTPLPTDTPPPTETPAPAVSDTPTETPAPTPTPTSAFAFVLETAEKFPTDSLAAGVVRIYLYVYSPLELGLGGYSLQVAHNGVPLVVDEVSTAGAPDVTRSDPGPFTRFTNMNVIFAESQAGRWEIQLVDQNRQPAGPAAVFDLTADEVTRELYVRYLRQQ